MKEIKNLSEIGQDKTLVYVTAPWCGPCQAIMPGIEEVLSKYPDAPVVKLTINTWDSLQNTPLDKIRRIPSIALLEKGNVLEIKHASIHDISHFCRTGHLPGQEKKEFVFDIDFKTACKLFYWMLFDKKRIGTLFDSIIIGKSFNSALMDAKNTL